MTVISDLKNVLIASREVTSGIVIGFDASNSMTTIATKEGRKTVPYAGTLKEGDSVTLKAGVATRVLTGKVYYI